MAGEDAPKAARQARRKYEFAVLVLVVGALALFLLRALDDALAHREAFGGALPAGDNPLRWVERQPAAYLGELDAVPVARGVWYFDRAHGELVYRFKSGREARFRLVRGAAAAGVAGTLGGVGLLRVDTAKPPDAAEPVIPTEGSAKPTVGRNPALPEDFSSFLGFARNSK